MLETMGQGKHRMRMFSGSGKTLTQALTDQGGLGLSLQTGDDSAASLGLNYGRAPAQRENLGLQPPTGTFFTA